MKMHSWGRYPVSDTTLETPTAQGSFAQYLATLREDDDAQTIARGMGRSYGDSALSHTVLATKNIDNFISFDEDSGLLRCAAGLTLDAILQVFMPRGWFLAVVPGTRYVSVGGAIASDVHGKNHHVDGTFCEHVTELKLLLASGTVLNCSRAENVPLFHATCAGMGLTGIVLEATLRLRRIHSSSIEQRTIRTNSLEEAFEKFEQNLDCTYSVAWLDCLATGQNTGRSLLFLGEHTSDEKFVTPGKRSISVPFSSPSFLLNRYSMGLFNNVYFHKPIRAGEVQRIEAFQYFFPLDSIQNWNRLYGSKGFLQYQCVIPDEGALEGMRKILNIVSAAGKGSFLSVLKKFGPANQNLLSFPMQGYTLAMDFKFEQGVLPLLDELDRVVADHGGRLYLAKDARMSAEFFQSSYPHWERMREIRREFSADSLFHSLQSQRLGL